MRVTNNSRATTYSFVKAGGKVKDGVPETVSIAPNETANLDVADSDLIRLQTIILYSDGDLTASAKDTERAVAALASEPEGSSSRRPKPPQVI